MCAKSVITVTARALSILPAIAALLLLTGGEGYAEPITKETQCTKNYESCSDACDTKSLECGKANSANYNSCWKDCIDICRIKDSDCRRASAPKPKTPLTKVQPKVKPGGVETPGTESPNVQPEGGIQRY